VRGCSSGPRRIRSSCWQPGSGASSANRPSESNR
jgi:hypothetical protein